MDVLASLPTVTSTAARKLVEVVPDCPPISAVDSIKENLIDASAQFVTERSKLAMLELFSSGNIDLASLSERFQSAGTALKRETDALMLLDSEFNSVKSKLIRKAIQVESVCDAIDAENAAIAKDADALRTVRESLKQLSATDSSTSAGAGVAPEVEAGARASRVLGVLHGAWATESDGGGNRTTLGLPIIVGDVSHTLNVHLRAGGTILTATLDPSDVPIADIVTNCVSCSDPDSAMRLLVSDVTSRIRSYITLITTDFKDASPNFRLSFIPDAPSVKATFTTGVEVEVPIPFEYDAKSATFFQANILAGPADAGKVARRTKFASISQFLAAFC